MPGLLSAPRGGNRAELLADYILSSIGISTPIRHQDDTGFDFYCQLGDNEGGYLTFGYPFIIQVKDYSEQLVVEYGNKRTWKPEQTNWLFRNQNPFFIGNVNRDSLQIDIYDTTGLWDVYNNISGYCSQIRLKAVEKPEESWRVNFRVENLQDWTAGNGDGKRYTVDIGKPIVSINHDDIEDDTRLRNKKEILRHVIKIEQKNILYRNFGIRAFTVIKKNGINDGKFETGMALMSRSDEAPDLLYESFREGLIGLQLGLSYHNRPTEANDLTQVLKNIPYHPMYDQLYEQNKGLLAWMKPIIEKKHSGGD
jgi:hypothetical protein